MHRCLVALAVALAAALAAAPVRAEQAVSIMHGFADMASTTLWVQTERPARVAVDLYPEGEAAKRRRVEGATRAEDDFALHLRLAGLEPGTRYRYQVLIDGRAAGEPGTFATQPLWQYRAEPPELVVAFGSCAYVNDRFSRPGPPWGGDYGIFDAIAARAPDLMLWLGDNVYFREPEWTSIEGMSARYRAYRAMPELRRLARAGSNLAIWDDHDFGPNDSDGSFTMKGAALEVFKRYWANPSYGLPGVPGVFGMATLGDVDFFLLDNRFYRYPNRYPPVPEKAMFGAAQLEWLKQALVASRATFKVIVGGSQFWNRRNRYESFGNYPAEQRALAEWLAEQRIEGVLFLSGDRHFSQLLRVERPGMYPIHEFTSSPLTAGPFRDLPADERANPEVVPGTIVTERSFGMLRFSGPRKDRAVTLEAYASDGRLLWQRRLAAAELR
ncbi:MAG TPA: alkaline phosphatase D family protein [Burkholderiales bacterium]|nr:alkaline phosphatase D family protein [Burkholderiales bacterium]